MKIGTRHSKLARAQTELVVQKLRKIGITSQIVEITTWGDLNKKPIFNIDKTGIFSNELNEKVLDRTVDIAVHSMKDLPTELHDELEIIAVLERGAVEDVLISKWNEIKNLPSHSKIGTSSIRRRYFLKFYREDLEIVDIRGNIDTRISKLSKGLVDGIVLAKAGVDRLHLNINYTVLDKWLFVPQANQGAIAVVARKDSKNNKILKYINHKKSMITCMLEREILRYLNAGCHAPFGIYAWIEENNIILHVAEITSDLKERKELILKDPDVKTLVKKFRKQW